ncbi:sporulation inhibitor of replication protein SirA [Bacillus sp. DJP31]|uniref:sporulation inhibitor of replication protein SirA n=1 Tax=Bacillus sp. DJP31 TaxID=3409789 RepID=UPI003BB59F7A
MREYTIYWIEEEFAHHYFGREKMFYHLFEEYTSAIGELRPILNKQVNYVTKPIPVLHINQFIQNEMKTKTNYRFIEELHIFQANKNKSKATLHVSEQHLTLVGTGEYEAEMTFFELLRKWDSRFLAVDTNQMRFGWLTPIKQRKFV